MTIPRHPSYQDVESAYQALYRALFSYLDDAGDSVDQKIAVSLDQDLCDVWDRIEMFIPCDVCDCFPCRCEAGP